MESDRELKLFVLAALIVGIIGGAVAAIAAPFFLIARLGAAIKRRLGGC